MISDYPPKISEGMICYTKRDVIIAHNEIYGINKVIPKQTLVQIKRKAAVSLNVDSIECYVVYFKLSTGIISDTTIERRHLAYYSKTIKDLWSNYDRYAKDLQDKLSLQAN
jgi:hypothetical protein